MMCSSNVFAALSHSRWHSWRSSAVEAHRNRFFGFFRFSTRLALNFVKILIKVRLLAGSRCHCPLALAIRKAFLRLINRPSRLFNHSHISRESIRHEMRILRLINVRWLLCPTTLPRHLIKMWCDPHIITYFALSATHKQWATTKKKLKNSSFCEII